MQSRSPVYPTVIAAPWDAAATTLYETAVELVFYVVFLAMCILVAYLFNYNKISGSRFLLAATSVMLVLGTIQVALKITLAVFSLRVVRSAVEGESSAHNMFIYDRIVFVRYVILITNNALTDSLFVYRCYVVWSRAISVTILPITMLAATTLLGYVTAIEDNYLLKSTVDFRIAFLMSVITNSMLTTLTAGRIWWLGREALFQLIESTSAWTSNYNTAVVMVLESGAIYSFCVIAYLVSGAIHTPSATVINDVLTAVLPQLVNIVPTLIIVRVGLSRGGETRRCENRGSGFIPTPSFTSIGMNPLA